MTPLVRHRHRAPSSRVLLPLLSLVVCLAQGALPTDAASASIRLLYQKSPALDLRYPPPPLLGRAALVYDVAGKRVLYAANQDLPLPMASTTKLMTALLVLEHGHLDTQTTVSYQAVLVGGSTMNLYAGEVLSLRDLLYGLLLPSGNDAAVALAEAVGGSEQQFVAMMNARCKRLGCTHTQFTSPHGLDMPGHYASARDLLLIAQADLRYPIFRAIVRTHSYTIASTVHNNSHTLINVNQPLWWYPGVQGIKPGNTTNAGFCDVLYVVRRHSRLIAVFLGMPDRYTDVRDLLDYALSDFTWHSPTVADPTMEARLYPHDDFSYDSPYRYLVGNDSLGHPYRYYVGTGYYLRPPFLRYYAAHQDLGLPTSEAVTHDALTLQRFGATVLIYNRWTATFTRVPSQPAVARG